MTDRTSSVSASPHEVLTSYVDELHHAYYRWYSKSVRRAHLWWSTLQMLTLLVGFASATIAAAIPEARFNGPWRAALIILPIVGSLASSALLQFRIYDLWKLREDGRRQLQDLVTEGRRRTAAATSPQECTQIHADLQAKVDRVERQQSEQFFTLAKSSPITMGEQSRATPAAG